MVNLVIVRNPFDVESREAKELAYKPSEPISFYFQEDGKWIYSINAEVVEPNTMVKDNDYIVIMPLIEGKWFRILLTIGLSVATAGIFGAANGIFGAMNPFWRAFSAMAISMIGNAIINKICPVKTDTSNTEQTATYGWSGAQTVVGQGFPLPITYGVMKSGGMLLSRHIISDGEKQYLNMLYCAGEGEIASISDVRINDNPVANYSDVEVDIRLGTNDQEVIPNFNDNYSDQQLAYELTSDWSTQLVEGNSCQGLEVTLSLPNGLYYSNDSGGMSETSVTVEAQYRVALGEWINLPLSNDTNNPLKRLYTYAATFVPTFANTFAKIAGALVPLTSSEHTGLIKGKTNEAMYRVFRFDNLPPAQYEVRVRCTSKSGTTIRYVNKIYWSQLTQIVYDDFIHPGKALIGIRALATDQLSGSEPQITWLQTRQNVLAYNPYTLTYETKPANNPAWACYDILHHARLISSTYIVKGVPAGQIDYDTFNAWAAQCNTKGYEFNYIYDSAARIWDALQYPEVIGHGHVIIKGTRFSCVYDYASNPVQLFTVANIKKDSFKEDFQGTQGRANCVEVSFVNAAKNYERDVLPVYSDDYDNTDSLNEPTQIELMGCTNVGQAYAHGRQYLRNNKYEIRTVTFEAYVDAIACTLADVVLVSHDVTEWGTSGRITAVDGLELTLDTEVTMVAGQTYSILIRDGGTDTINTYSVTTVAGTANVITLTSGAANINDIFAFGLVGAEAKKFKVISITKGHTEQTRKLTCMEYFEELYDASGDTPPSITYTQNVINDVTNLSVSPTTYRQKDGGIQSDISVSWINPRKFTSIEVYYKQSDTQDYLLFNTYKAGENKCNISNVLSLNSYDIKVVATNDIGLSSPGMTRTVYVAGKDLAPNDIISITAVQDTLVTANINLSWVANTDIDLKGYYLYDGADVQLTDIIYGNSYTYKAPSSGTYTFKVKAVDKSNNISLNSATTTITITVSPYIPPALIEEESLNLSKMDSTFKDAVINTSTFLANFLQLIGTAEQYSGIAQLPDAVQLRVKNADGSTSLINVSPNVITIVGKYLHITGETVFDDSVIVNNMLAANAITADKLAAAAIDLSGELKIVGGAVTIDENGMTVLETGGTKTVFDANGITFLNATGTASGAIRKVICGTAPDGSFIHFAEPWDTPPYVMVAPKEAQTTVAGYSNSSVKTVCEAYSNDTVNDPQMLTGFRVKMKSYLISGTGGGATLSEYDIDADGTISPETPAATTELAATVTVNLGNYIAAHEEVDNTIIHRAYTDIDPGAGWFADRNNYVVGAISFTNGRYFTQAGALQETKSGTAWTLNDNANGMTHNMATTVSHTHMFYDAYYNPATDSLKNLYFNRSFTHRHVKNIAAVSTSGSVTIAFYYKLSTDTEWTHCKNVTYTNTPTSATIPDQSYTETVASNLPAGIYQIKAVLTASTCKNTCRLASYDATSTGAELTGTNGTVNFLAIETDKNNYYTIE